MSQNTEIEILLAEDNARDAEVTIRTLRKHKIANQITHVEDGQQALDCIFGTGPYAGRDPANHPKLLLLDLKLPKVDGLEVLRAIRGDERTRLMTVVMMTSSREQQDVIESYKLGVNSYVVKPVEFDNFSAAIAELGHYWLLVNQGPR